MFLVQQNIPSVSFLDPFAPAGKFPGLFDIAGVSSAFPAERTFQWNVSVGRQFWGTAIDIGYVGTHALNIPYTEDLNLLRPSTIPFDAANRPYQRFGSANLTQTGGSSIYHGFNIQADRRLAKGLSFNVNYTWAKSLTDTTLGGLASSTEQNQDVRRLERADDSLVRRHGLRFSYVYHLPFGRGQHLLGNLSGAQNQVIGGWGLSGI